MTWWLVTISPSVPTTTPEPSEFCAALPPPVAEIEEAAEERVVEEREAGKGGPALHPASGSEDIDDRRPDGAY